MSATRYRFSLCFVFLICLFLYNPALSCGEPKDGGNILIFWTEKDSLKAVTLMSVQSPGRPVGIVGIPVHISIDQEKPSFTIAEAYRLKGRQGMTATLEEMFRTDIGSYLVIDQATLMKLSNIIGPVLMEDRPATLIEVFEGTYMEKDIEPQWEIRCLAAQLVTFRVLVKVPQLIRIIHDEVKTNLGFKNLLNIYRAVETQGSDILNKKVLTGRDYYINNRKYRDVQQDTWEKALNEVTRA